MKEIFVNNKEIVLYLVFGVLTTLVNIVGLKVFAKIFKAKSILYANTVAWVLSVAFAYVTNKIWVFESLSWSLSLVLKEAGMFTAARLVTFGIDSLIMFYFVDVLKKDKLITKIGANVIVVILNYIFSKLLIF